MAKQKKDIASLSEDKDFNLWALLRLTERAIFKAREKELSQYGITLEQAAVCFYICALGEDASPTNLARWMLREPHTISGILDRMEGKGLLLKTRSPHGKQLKVALTEKGQEAYEQSTSRESIHRIVSCLSNEEREQMWSALNKLQDAALKELRIFDKPPFPP